MEYIVKPEEMEQVKARIIELQKQDIPKEEILKIINREFYEQEETKNTNIKEDMNTKLERYINKIENNEFSVEDVPYLMEDYIGYFDEESNIYQTLDKYRIRYYIPKITKQISKYYDCREEEIYVNGIDFKKTVYTTVPYKIIFGYADFIDSQITNLGNLAIIGYDADFANSQITNLENLTYVGGYIDFRNSPITDLGNLSYVGGKIFYEGSIFNSLEEFKEYFNQKVKVKK